MQWNIAIQSQKNRYRVLLIESQNALLQEIQQVKQSIIIVDKQIALYYPDFVAELREIKPVLCIDATEETKTWSGVNEVLLFLQQQQAVKKTTVMAIGGGIVQDIASFAAHIYHRGLPFVFIPTTLLAMCDSCIGGKCGLNYAGYKNQLGAFHSPEKVLIWTGFLNSLPMDAIYSGYGEIFKLMLIGGSEHYSHFLRTISQEGFKNSQIAQFIYYSLEIKKKFIEEDEFDLGVRRILNYGHTFGHAIELATQYSVPHGIAVAKGVDIANFIAARLGFLDNALYDEIHYFINRHFNPLILSKLQPEQLIKNAQKDKKIADGKLNMILLEKIGKLRIEPVILDARLEPMLEDYLTRVSVARVVEEAVEL